MNIPYSYIRPDYWKVYNNSKINCVKEVYQTVSWAIALIGSPWRKTSRGRPYGIEPKEYASLIITMFYFGWSYRELEGYSELLIGKRIDSSNIGWAMKRINASYMKKANLFFYSRINTTIDDGDNIFIVDSTGIATDRYYTALLKLKLRRKLQELKLHIITRYYPENGIMAIACIGSSKGRAHDSPQFRRIFDPALVNNGMLFADSAYPCEENRKLLVGNNIIPAWKWKQDDERFPYSDLYQEIRGIIEALFGGMENRYGNKTRQRNKHTREIAVMLLALSHNIRSYLRVHEMEISYMRLRREKKQELFFIVGVIRQTRGFSRRY